MIDRRWHVGRDQQAPLLAHLHGDGVGADAVENLAGKGVGDHAARRGVEDEGRGIGGAQAVVEPVQAEIGDRRDIDQHLGQHHEQDREDEELARQAKPRPGRARRSLLHRLSICCHI